MCYNKTKKTNAKHFSPINNSYKTRTEFFTHTQRDTHTQSTHLNKIYKNKNKINIKMHKKSEQKI